MDIEDSSWLGESYSILRRSAGIVSAIGVALDWIHLIKYPYARQVLIDKIGPVCEYIGNFSVSYLAAVAGTCMLPIMIEVAIPDRLKELITLRRSAIIIGILLPLVGNIIAEKEIFSGRNFVEHSGDIAMGTLAIGLGVLSSRIIYEFIVKKLLAFCESKWKE